MSTGLDSARRWESPAGRAPADSHRHGGIQYSEEAPIAPAGVFRGRVLSVGDLINRRPNSIDALSWFKGGRFGEGVVGIHEEETVHLIQSEEVTEPTKPYQQ